MAEPLHTVTEQVGAMPRERAIFTDSSFGWRRIFARHAFRFKRRRALALGCRPSWTGIGMEGVEMEGFVVMTMLPVVMRPSTAEKDCPLSFVGMMMGSIVLEVWQFDLEKFRLRPYFDRRTPLEARMHFRQYCTISLSR